MSRHAIPLKPSADATEAIIGWDRSLQTFFVQVLRRGDDGENEILLWEGADYREIRTTDGCAPAARAVVRYPRKAERDAAHRADADARHP